MLFSKTVTVALSAAALTLAPLMVPDLPSSLGPSATAQAKDNNGNGNGNGRGGGRGNGNPGVTANAHARADTGAPVSNGRALGRSKAGDRIANTVNSVGNGVVGFLGDVFGGKGHGYGRSKSRTTARGHASPHVSLARVDAVPMARPNAKERNFNAKLAGLNSLNRNYHAYINSKDPRMAAIRSYIDASIAYENAAAAFAAATATLATAELAFEAVLVGVQAHDDYSYDDRSIAELTDRLADLQTIDRTGLMDAENAAIDAEIESLTAALNSTEAGTLADAQTAADAAAETEAALEAATSDEALTDALLAAANDNRIAEYGEENYVDEEMLDWAKDLLGVGDAYGKIDEIREARAADIPAVDDGVNTTVTLEETVDTP